MSAIGPGDFVECVREDPDVPVSAVPGQVYQVREVKRATLDGSWWMCSICGNLSKDDVLDLVGFKVDPHSAFCLCCFKPAGRRGMFDQLLTVTEELVDA